MRFEAAQQGDEYTVILEKTKSCRTPCELVASPGFQVVKVEGAARFSEVVAFPAAPATVKIEKWRPGGTVAGVVGLAVGLPAATIGGVLALSGAGLGPFSASPGGVIKQPAMTYSGLGLLAVGIAFAAVGGGVGFGIAGHDRLRLTQGQSCAPRAPPLQPLSFGVAPTNGGAIVGAAFAF